VRILLLEEQSCLKDRESARDQPQAGIWPEEVQTAPENQATLGILPTAALHPMI
jgi:hypothetical protein